MTKDLVTILTVTLLTVFAWIAFESYHNKTNIYILDEIKQYTSPLNPNLDVDFVKHLRELEVKQ